MSSPTSLQQLDTIEQLEAVKQQWDNLGSSIASPTQTASWLQSAAAAFPQWALRALVLDDGGLEAAAPLVSRFRYREAASVRQLYEPVDLLWASESALERLTESIARRHLPLVLGRVPSESPSVGALRAAYGRSAAVVTRPRSGLPVVELDEGWQEPESKFNADRRSDFRRARRRAEEVGPVELELCAPQGADVGPVLDAALDVELRSWKGQTGTALLQDPLRLAFFRDYAARSAADGNLRIVFLRAGETAIAMQLAVERGGSMWLLKIAYDEEHRRSSPGQLLMLEMIRRQAAELQTIEFMGASAPWVTLWATYERPSSSVAFLPARPGSLPPLAETGLRPLAARVHRSWASRPGKSPS